MSKRVAFYTLGCKLNQAETSALRADFVRKGYQVVPFGGETDLVVVNTCTVTETADAECRQVIRRGLSKAPNAAVAVTGCYAQLKPEEIASIKGVKGVFGTAEKMTIANIAEEMLRWETPKIFVQEFSAAEPTFVHAQTSLPGERSRAYLKLQDGCDYSCTFCTIPIARGPARAMHSNDVEHHLRELVNLGYAEVILTGINLGEYRSADGKRFMDILQLIEAVAPPFRVRISSIEPNTVSKEMIDLIASSKTFVHHLHIPLQSGSAQILRAMRRRYNPEMYRNVIDYARERMPDAAIGVDVIVGFPGETDKHFDETYEFLESLPFTYLHVFSYSERANTPATTLGDKVLSSVVTERSRLLRELSVRRERMFWSENCGKVFTVISDVFDSDAGTHRGVTENYIPTSFTGPKELFRKPVRVRLDAVLAKSVASTCLSAES